MNTEEIKKITSLLEDNFIALHPISDQEMVLTVKNCNELGALSQLGYHPHGKEWKKEGSPFILHCYEKDDPERDYVIAHPDKSSQENLMQHTKNWISQGPTPDTTFPMPLVGNQVCYLKNVITNPNIIVGDYTYYHDYQGADNFEKNNVLYHEPFIGDKLIIGKFCQLALGVRFIMNASMHETSGFSTYPFAIFSSNWATKYDVKFPFKGDTVLGNDIWMGYQACIMPGINIGDGAIIASHSLITKDVPPYAIVGGNPAQVLRMRFSEDVIQELLQLRWWDWPMETILNHLPEITGADLEKLKKVQA